MNAQELARHTHEQEVHRLLVQNERLRKRMQEAYELAREIGEVNLRLATELETLRAAKEYTPRQPRPDDVLPLPWLRQWREEKAILQGQLARMAGLYQKDVSWIERGKRMAYRTTAEKLAAALGITLDELLAGPGGEK